MVSLWSIAYFFLTIQVVTVVLLLLPMPQFLRSKIVHFVHRFSTVFLAMGVLFGMLAWDGYEGFTKKHPYGSWSDAKDAALMGIGQASYFRHQRNFYIATFGAAMCMVIQRVSQILKHSIEVQEELQRVKNLASQRMNQ